MAQETTRFIITMPTDLKDLLEERSAEDCRSMNSFIVALLKDTLMGGSRISANSPTKTTKTLRKKV